MTSRPAPLKSPWLRRSVLAAALPCLALVGCDDDDGGSADAGARLDAATQSDGGVSSDGAPSGDGAPRTDGALAQAGCDPGCVVASALTREAFTTLPADATTQAAGNTAFALKLYRTLRTEPGNLFFSPYSISTALSMTYAGARGTTASEMEGTLEFKLPQDRLHRALNALDQELARRESDSGGQGKDPFQLRVANSIWGRKNFTFQPAFLDTLAVNYGAGLRVLDFAADPELARGTINGWVADKTAQRIKDLLPMGTIKSETVMVLTNAIYFKASWASTFEAAQTQASPFTLRDGTTVVQVPTMRQTAQLLHADAADHETVAMPYVGGKVQMVIIVPKAGKLDAVEQAMTGTSFAAAVDALQSKQVKIELPKFTFSSGLSLKQALSAMGMPVAFSDGANFTGMAAGGMLTISDVVHKAFVAIDEKGTEAAAATGVIIGPTSVPPPPIEMKVNRPFLFFVYDQPTRTVLFAGRVLDPR